MPSFNENLMTKVFILLIIIAFVPPGLKAQHNIEVLIPESYELSNIILALTDYGKADEWEVQKKTAYYKEVMAFFEPVKDHPLLKKVNYSRELWENYLSFRTDAIAFDFDNSGQLKRDFIFYTNEGHNPFDENITLINDFILKSGFRTFYKKHQLLYNSIVANYSGYYMLDTMKQFLQKISGSTTAITSNEKYKIILSPLVNRMNCHRDIDSITKADFPALAISLIENNSKEIENQADRATEIHTIFTEMDHGYVNPVSTQFEKSIETTFINKYWDNNSGYAGLSCFNEYMTWALYDLFLKKHFPLYADSLNTQWHYQNASRGIYASSLFAMKLNELYQNKKSGETLKDLYPKLLKWTEKNQERNKMLMLMLPKKDSIYTLSASNEITLHFTTGINKKLDQINCIALLLKNGKQTNESKTITVTKKDIKWISDGSITIKVNPGYKEFGLIFNWWGCRYPLLSDWDIMLNPQSFILLKQHE